MSDDVDDRALVRAQEHEGDHRDDEARCHAEPEVAASRPWRVLDEQQDEPDDDPERRSARSGSARSGPRSPSHWKKLFSETPERDRARILDRRPGDHEDEQRRHQDEPDGDDDHRRPVPLGRLARRRSTASSSVLSGAGVVPGSTFIFRHESPSECVVGLLDASRRGARSANGGLGSARERGHRRR